MKHKKTADKLMWKRFFWIVVGFAVIVFAVFMLILRSTISGISRDPSVVSLTNDAVFDVVQIMNINENKYANQEDCWFWNRKNPNLKCHDANAITNGNYILRGVDLVWLEGPIEAPFLSEIYIMPEEIVRDALGGFMKSDKTYYQIIKIEIENEEMTVEIETQNDQGESNTDTIKFYLN